jgi:hypothetical protein
MCDLYDMEFDFEFDIIDLTEEEVINIALDLMEYFDNITRNISCEIDIDIYM